MQASKFLHGWMSFWMSWVFLGMLHLPTSHTFDAGPKKKKKRLLSGMNRRRLKVPFMSLQPQLSPC